MSILGEVASIGCATRSLSVAALSDARKPKDRRIFGSLHSQSDFRPTLLASITTDRPEPEFTLKDFAGLKPGIHTTWSPATIIGKAFRAGIGILEASSIFFTLRCPGPPYLSPGKRDRIVSAGGSASGFRIARFAASAPADASGAALS